MESKSKKSRSEVPFFVDRNIGTRIVSQAIRDAGYAVAMHDDHFDQDTTDVEWLTEIGKRRWPILSLDRRITKNIAELQALLSANVFAFFVSITNPNGQKIAEAVLKALPNIQQIIDRQEPPLIATIDKNGRVTKLKGYDQIQSSLEEMKERQHQPKPYKSFLDDV